MNESLQIFNRLLKVLKCDTVSYKWDYNFQYLISFDNCKAKYCKWKNAFLNFSLLAFIDLLLQNSILLDSTLHFFDNGIEFIFSDIITPRLVQSSL